MIVESQTDQRMREWSARWSLKLGKSFDEMTNLVKMADWTATTAELGKHFGVSSKLASYMLRGWLKFGHPRSKTPKATEKPLTVNGDSANAVAKAAMDTQALLDRQHELESKLAEVNKQIEMRKPLMRALDELRNAMKSIA